MKRNSTIKPYKETTCIDCGDDTIRKTISGRCFEYPFHYQKYKEKVYADRKANKDSGETKKLKPIPNVSQKQLERLKEYKKAKEEYFKEKPICEYPNCNSTQIQLHHRGGRIGSLLTDKRNFASLCDEHHRICELNPLHAKELGLSVDRLNK